jgi:hypothetical protein
MVVTGWNTICDRTQLNNLCSVASDVHIMSLEIGRVEIGSRRVELSSLFRDSVIALTITDCRPRPILTNMFINATISLLFGAGIGSRYY